MSECFSKFSRAVKKTSVIWHRWFKITTSHQLNHRCPLERIPPSHFWASEDRRSLFYPSPLVLPKCPTAIPPVFHKAQTDMAAISNHSLILCFGDKNLEDLAWSYSLPIIIWGSLPNFHRVASKPTPVREQLFQVSRLPYSPAPGPWLSPSHRHLPLQHRTGQAACFRPYSLSCFSPPCSGSPDLSNLIFPVPPWTRSHSRIFSRLRQLPGFTCPS